MKTKKSIAKRFKITANGKVKHQRSGRRHNLGPKKSKARKRRLRKAAYLKKGDAIKVLAGLGLK
ncbi:MAG: 50S ribosomal protein L35 [candidate division WOR-3 bacterium]